MSTDPETQAFDDFEAELAARLGGAAGGVTAGGVTRDGVDDRLAARAGARRRRFQGGLALAAAALVVAAGLAAVTVGRGTDGEGSVQAGPGGGPASTEATEPSAPPSTWSVTCGGNMEGYTPVPGQTSCPVTSECFVLGDPGTTDAAIPGCAPMTVPPTSTTPTTGAPPPTDAPTTTSAPPTSADTTTTAPPAPTTTMAPALVPGQACTPGSSRDCIDPEGDGSSVYLIGGGDCMASPIGGGECADLDGDGQAGYPDQG